MKQEVVKLSKISITGRSGACLLCFFANVIIHLNSFCSGMFTWFGDLSEK